MTGNPVESHYTTGSLIERIRRGLEQAGIDSDRPTAADLKPVDEFHIGGAAATEELLAQLPLDPHLSVLDIGSGIGGTARLIAERVGCRVTGIDLTREFVETATTLTALVGMDDRVAFQQGSALEMPFEEDSFDLATLIHVGMNIEDKHRLMAEAARVLRPGAHFAIYDIMRTAGGDLTYPLPWAETADTSSVASPDSYRAAAEGAGFSVVSTRDQRQSAIDFFEKRQAVEAAGEPPPLGQQILMGENAPTKIANLVHDVSAGALAPFEMVLKARR